MAEKDLRQVNCPDDDAILAFRRGELSGEEYEAVALHLLFCNDCVESLNSLPWEEAEGDLDVSEDELTPRVNITPSLSRAIMLFRERHQQSARETPGIPKEIQDGDLSAGQIWRTKSEEIVVPSPRGAEYHSVTELNSRPHLVVVTRTEVDDSYSGTDYHTILVAPVDGETEYKSEGDLLVAQEESPLGYSFIVQLWNEQPMLRENLDRCLGALGPEQHDTLLNALGDEESSGGNYSLEAVILKGLYQDPVMRYRAKEYEDTSYLRTPVQSLMEAEDSARDASVIRFPEPRYPKPVVRLAAGTEQEEEEALDVSGNALVVQARVMIGDQPFELAEDPAEGSVFLLGDIPPTATHILVGSSPYELKHLAGRDMVELSGIGISEIEEPLRRHFSDPVNNPVRFDTR